MQDFGDPATNGLNHSVSTTLDPTTQKQVQAVFIPKLAKGYWSGEVSNAKGVKDRQILDSDAEALRKNQLHPDCM